MIILVATPQYLTMQRSGTPDDLDRSVSSFERGSSAVELWLRQDAKRVIPTGVFQPTILNRADGGLEHLGC
jgi:hypothetical protein